MKRVTQRRSSITAAPRLSGPSIRTRLSLGTPLGLCRGWPEDEGGRYPRPARYSLRAACTTSTSLGGMSWSSPYASSAFSTSSAMVTDVRFMASILTALLRWCKRCKRCVTVLAENDDPALSQTRNSTPLQIPVSES